MKLKKFRVQNYKGVTDSGWIDCDSVLALVGKNEAGKTSLILALSKLNSTSETKYDGLKEFPRGRYTDEFSKKDWPVASAIFVLSDEERGHLTNIAPFFDGVEEVCFTRHYSDALEIVLEPAPLPPAVQSKEWVKELKAIRKIAEELIVPKVPAVVAPEKPDATAVADRLAFQEAQTKIPALASEEIRRCEQKTTVPKDSLVALRQGVIEATNHAGVRSHFQEFLDHTEGYIEITNLAEKIPEAKAFLAEKMPKFLFFANYEMLNSNIHLPEFVRLIKQGGHSAELRVQQAMFKFVGADIEKLSTLSKQTTLADAEPATVKKGERVADELTILASSAEAAMTRKFSEWWLQRDHKFRYEFSGEFFRVWVCDDHNPAFVELEQRSEGFRYFFSFYLLFLVEAAASHQNAILLLDEPGLHLHGTAQEKLLEFFDKLAGENETNVIYTTHSPFMIDGSHLERARAVFEGDNGTAVSADVWPKDKESLFPLQAALGYSICQALFVSKKQVLIEGPTDFLLLAAANNVLATAEKLSPEITLLPVGGAMNITPFASLLLGHGVQFAALLDMDDMGQKAKNSLLKLIPENEGRITSYGQILGLAVDAELEDIMPDAYYIACVRKVYGADFKVPAKSASGKIGVVDRCQEALKSAGLKLEKHRIVAEIVQDLSAGKAPQELSDACKLIFKHLNSLF